MTFASESGFATMLWSKHFATQNGLLSKFCYAKPPTASAVFAVFDRPVFFGVHTCMVNSFKALADGMNCSCLNLNKSETCFRLKSFYRISVSIYNYNHKEI